MTVMSSKIASPAVANAFLSFVNASPTPWHAVHSATALLENAGFKRVDEASNWEKDLKEGSKVFFTRSVANCRSIETCT